MYTMNLMMRDEKAFVLQWILEIRSLLQIKNRSAVWDEQLLKLRDETDRKHISKWLLQLQSRVLESSEIRTLIESGSLEEIKLAITNILNRR